MSKYNTAAPYIAAYVILRDGAKVAFVLRSNTSWMDGHYSLPSGKVEWGETFTNAAIREAKEEIGVDIKPEHMSQVLTLHRHSEDTDWVDAFFEAKSWEGDAVNAEPHVHGELAWLDTESLPANVVPSVRFALEQIEIGVHYAEYGWDSIV